MWPEPVSVDVMPKQCVTVKLYMLCLIVHLHDELVFDGVMCMTTTIYTKIK